MTTPSLPSISMSILSSATPVLRRSILSSRPRASSIITLNPARYKSTTRRMTKALRLHPHASFVGTASTIPSKSSHSQPSQSTPASPSFALPNIIYNPPAAAPTPLITPKLFLPQDDPRYSEPSASAILTSAPPAAPTATSPDGATNVAEGDPKKLPPALTRPYQKTYHLTEKEIKQIQKLRASNPDVWSRRKLAEKFGCSEFFVGMVAPTTEERKAQMKEELNKVKAKWGKVRTFAREERARRRELWSKDL
ncbi:hypothetical protein ABW19_dt0208772 [Dactylella cylindrospora]|nr:hypothetical protein ABW19_dt0208772 [Dactylella cylindrospora]